MLVCLKFRQNSSLKSKVYDQKNFLSEIQPSRIFYRQISGLHEFSSSEEPLWGMTSSFTFKKIQNLKKEKIIFNSTEIFHVKKFRWIKICSINSNRNSFIYQLPFASHPILLQTVLPKQNPVKKTQKKLKRKSIFSLKK